MAFIGMTIDEVRAAMNELSRQAQILTGVKQRVTSQTDYASSNWYGPGFGKFANTWEGCRLGLNQAIDRLQRMSSELKRQIDEQERVSAPDTQPISISRVNLVDSRVSSAMHYPAMPPRDVLGSTRSGFDASKMLWAWRQGLISPRIGPFFGNLAFWGRMA